MAKLTRTQKYASLRDELANDKETNYTSQNLASYEDRFNNVQETLAPKPVVNQTEQVDFGNQANTWQNFNQAASTAYQQPVYQQPVYQQQVAPQPVVQQQPAQQPVYQQPAARPVQQQAAAPVNNDSAYFNSFMSQPAESKPEAFDFNSLFGAADDKKDDLNIDAVYQDVFKDVEDTTDDSISRKERDTYLNQTISDVNYHNIVNGQATLNQTVDNIVDEVRHAQTVTKPVSPTWPTIDDKQDLDADEPIAQEPVINANKADEEFSNTVSVEISKIMDQMGVPATNPAPRPAVAESVVQQPVQPQVAQPVQQAAPQPAQQKAEEVVEIKNLNEIKNEPITNTVSSTIPFVVSNDDEQDIEDDEEEEDGSNTILNIILIVLIVVLIAVLGLIVFYILKTKGIF